MKKFVAGLMIGATLMSGVSYAASSKVEVSLQSLKFLINGKSIQQTGFIHDGTAYVPVRFVSETLGKKVIWDDATRTIHIDDKSEGNAQVNITSYKDGVYRGMFADRGDIQVSVEFKIKDNIVTEVSFRQLFYNGMDYRTEKENALIIGLRGQHEELLNYLVGKDIRTSIEDLYSPGNIVTENVDTFTGATLRSGKIISSVRDALNRGVYKY